MEDYYISSRFERFSENVRELFGDIEESATEKLWEVIRADLTAASNAIKEMEALGADTAQTELHGDILSRLEECAEILDETDFGTEESNEESLNAAKCVKQVIKKIRGWENDIQRVIKKQGYDGCKACAND